MSAKVTDARIEKTCIGCVDIDFMSVKKTEKTTEKT